MAADILAAAIGPRRYSVAGRSARWSLLKSYATWPCPTSIFIYFSRLHNTRVMRMARPESGDGDARSGFDFDRFGRTKRRDAEDAPLMFDIDISRLAQPALPVRCAEITRGLHFSHRDALKEKCSPRCTRKLERHHCFGVPMWVVERAAPSFGRCLPVIGNSAKMSFEMAAVTSSRPATMPRAFLATYLYIILMLHSARELLR